MLPPIRHGQMVAITVFVIINIGPFLLLQYHITLEQPGILTRALTAFVITNATLFLRWGRVSNPYQDQDRYHLLPVSLSLEGSAWKREDWHKLCHTVSHLYSSLVISNTTKLFVVPLASQYKPRLLQCICVLWSGQKEMALMNHIRCYAWSLNQTFYLFFLYCIFVFV